MKKTKNKLICLILVLGTLFLTSCQLYVEAYQDKNNENEKVNEDDLNDIPNGVYPEWNFYPEGYTAGFPSRINKSAPRVEFWWVETYEEVLEAVELLKLHGSTFEKTAIFTHDGDVFDTKYCFEISLENRFTEKIEFGDDPFDRCAGNVKIVSYAFIDDVSIGEINRSDIQKYEAYRLYTHFTYNKQPPLLIEDNITYSWNDKYKELKIFDSHKLVFTLNSFGYYEEPEKACERIKTVFESLIFIGFDDE